MYYSVVSAEYAGDYRLYVTFEDGHAGVADLEPYVRRGGVFAPLAEQSFFRQFRINPDFGVICWGDDVDIAPERLYEQVVSPIRALQVAEDRAPYDVPADRDNRRRSPACDSA